MNRHRRLYWADRIMDPFRINRRWPATLALTFGLLTVIVAGNVRGAPPDGDAVDERPPDVKIGLALGSGGANGLAHIRVLEAFEALEIKPHCIAGSSIGAIIGALYASGHSAADIKDIVSTIIGQSPKSVRDAFPVDMAGDWLRLLDLELGDGGLLSGSAVIDYLKKQVKVETFDALQIPLYVVAADLWTREQVVFSQGDIYPALQASMAVPGLFAPVEHGDRMLIDGAMVNPVPFDLLFEECDRVVAVNVINKRQRQSDPSLFRTMFSSIHVMQTAILNEKMAQRKPDIYIETDHDPVRMLSFHELDSLYEQTRETRERLEKQLRSMLHPAPETANP